ncbi:MAG: TetR/AcrR family transcriptional regulator [Hyphomicrobiales bacterium]|nr:TetR/AcrR family transcriptional regulator [Hyphomicrobiales bacterium]
MTVNTNAGSAKSTAKAKYHHGGLREALIDAAYQFVLESGGENFSLADACRCAGVSTAAPYRHFKDRDEILAEVCSRGFEEMTAMAQEAVRTKGEGTLEGIIAMGQTYVAFAVENQGLFRLMFGQNQSVSDVERVVEKGNDCFGYLIEQITIYCQANGLDSNADDDAVKLWTFVHGTASLLMDGKYDKVTPGLDVEQLIASATPQLLNQSD